MCWEKKRQIINIAWNLKPHNKKKYYNSNLKEEKIKLNLYLEQLVIITVRMKC